jgi:hypothetical protein
MIWCNQNLVLAENKMLVTSGIDLANLTTQRRRRMRRRKRRKRRRRK